MNRLQKQSRERAVANCCEKTDGKTDQMGYVTSVIRMTPKNRRPWVYCIKCEKIAAAAYRLEKSWNSGVKLPQVPRHWREKSMLGSLACFDVTLADILPQGVQVVHIVQQLQQSPRGYIWSARKTLMQPAYFIIAIIPSLHAVTIQCKHVRDDHIIDWKFSWFKCIVRI